MDAVRDGAAELNGEDARHLVRVLRAEPGQQYEISDGAGAWVAVVSSVGRDRVGFQVLEPAPSRECELAITLLASLVKFDRFEWLIEKATELGVTAIQPAAAERSERGLLQAAAKRAARWGRIALESGQQARRLRPPEILPPAPLARCLSAGGSRLYLEEESGAQPLAAALTPESAIVLAVGPEGGWTAAERERFHAACWRAVSLGPFILRAETAAMAALSVLTHTRWAALARIE